MWHRLARAIRYALKEEDFAPVLAAGVFLIVLGTITYTLGNGWKLVDGFYFAVATLTTSSIANPHLTITDDWMKVFTVFYILIGIGILVEVVRRVGIGFVAVSGERRHRSATSQGAGGGGASDEG